MSAEAAALVRTWPVGRYTATLTVPQPKPGAALAAVVEWTPHLPRRLSGSQLRAYRRGRNAALAELARTLGGAAVVLEV